MPSDLDTGARRGLGRAAQYEGAREAPVHGAPRLEVRPWLVRDYEGYGGGIAPHRLILTATTSVPLVFKIVDTPHRPSAFAMGAHDSYAVMEGQCAPSYLEMRLSPLGAYTVLGLPLDELTGQIVDVADVFGVAGTELIERIREESCGGRRFAALDRFLMQQGAEGPQPPPEVNYAWRRIKATGGAVPISRLVEEVGWSHRHLIAMFKRHIGVTPRAAARIIRFERVLRRVDRRAPVRWDRIAADLGYADQAHLIRDFKTFSGTTPAAFRSDSPKRPG
jgi:AraC-like DNA-binding protein